MAQGVDSRYVGPKRRLVLHLAWRDHRERFLHTGLGAFWTTVNVALNSLILASVWSVVFGLELRQHLPYVSTGLLVWQLIQGCFSEAPTHLIASRGLLLNSRLSLELVSQRLIVRQFLSVVFAIPIPMGIILATGHLTLSVLLAPVTLLMVTSILYPYVRVLGVVAIRFRGLEHFIQPLLTLISLVTPIVYDKAQLGEAGWIATLNPVYWMIDIVRVSMLGEFPRELHFLVMSIICVSGWICVALVRNLKVHAKTAL